MSACLRAYLQLNVGVRVPSESVNEASAHGDEVLIPPNPCLIVWLNKGGRITRHNDVVKHGSDESN